MMIFFDAKIAITYLLDFLSSSNGSKSRFPKWRKRFVALLPKWMKRFGLLLPETIRRFTRRRFNKLSDRLYGHREDIEFRIEQAMPIILRSLRCYG